LYRSNDPATGERRPRPGRWRRIFVCLLLGQWIFAVAVALFVSPSAWTGLTSYTHPHVWFALAVGALLALPPRRP
jgi:surface polysaccharide O-acyltransferase-like enzyme